MRKAAIAPVSPTKVALAVVQVELCVSEHLIPHLPDYRAAPTMLPLNAPVPRIGEVIYLSSTSAWMVYMVIHEYRSTNDLHIEVWLDWIGSARQVRPSECKLTH